MADELAGAHDFPFLDLIQSIMVAKTTMATKKSISHGLNDTGDLVVIHAVDLGAAHTFSSLPHCELAYHAKSFVPGNRHYRSLDGDADGCESLG